MEFTFMHLTAGGLLLALVLLLPLLAVAGGGTPPTVYRGDDGEMDAAAPPPPDAAPAPSQDETIVGGNRFWKVDPQSGKLLACRLVQTPNVGEQRIECAAGTLDQD